MKLEIVKLSRKWDGLHIRKSILERALSQHCYCGLDPQSLKDRDSGLRQNDNVVIAVALSTDAHIKALNSHYRDKDKPTNVLSFGNDTGGDIILAIETIRAESKAMNKPLRDHIEHLIVHGALHITGFDHENETDAEIMEAKETEICKKIGFDPYTY